jgi:hypothetical protein
MSHAEQHPLRVSMTTSTFTSMSVALIAVQLIAGSIFILSPRAA